MVRSFVVIGAVGLMLAGCQTHDPRYTYTDQECLNRQVGSRVMSAVAGIGLGLVGVPGGGIVVGLATDPRCQAYHLTPEGQERVRRQMEQERLARLRAGEDRDRVIRPTMVSPSGRPLDNIPNNLPAQPN